MICYNVYYDMRYHRNQHQQRTTGVPWRASFKPSVSEAMTLPLTHKGKENPKDAGGAPRLRAFSCRTALRPRRNEALPGRGLGRKAREDDFDSDFSTTRRKPLKRFK